MNIDIPADLIDSLMKASKLLKKEESVLIADALRVYLEDLEDAQDAAFAYQEWQQKGGRTIPFDKILKDVGLN